MVDGHGKLPKWPKGSDCKSAVYDFVSSNLALATITSAITGPPRHETGLSRFGTRGDLCGKGGAFFAGTPIRAGAAIGIS